MLSTEELDTAREAHGGRRGHKVRRVERLDTNQDGYLSQSEFMAGHSERAEKHFAKMDADADGLVSGDELGAARAARHSKRFEDGERGRSDKRFD